MGRQKWNEKKKKKNGEKYNEIQYDCERNICNECKKKKKKEYRRKFFFTFIYFWIVYDARVVSWSRKFL